MVRFDRAAPGEGMVIYSRLENGKAFLEFQFFLKTGEILANFVAHIQIYDKCHRVVLDIVYPLREEEPAKGMLMYPHLWKGSVDPYVYFVKVQLLDKKKGKMQGGEAVIDTMEKHLPLRSMELMPRKGWFLNGESYNLRPVVYELPTQSVTDISSSERMRKELQLLKEMGANAICLNQGGPDEDFIGLCDEMGFLVWYLTGKRGFIESNALLAGASMMPTDLYYYYKACWSQIPFVYPVRDSFTRQKNGKYSLMVYSNQKKVALYVEGILFEFKTGAQEFLFEEIPAEKYPLQLTVEAGECRVALTMY